MKTLFEQCLDLIDEILVDFDLPTYSEFLYLRLTNLFKIHIFRNGDIRIYAEKQNHGRYVITLDNKYHIIYVRVVHDFLVPIPKRRYPELYNLMEEQKNGATTN